jgi:CBS domain-containing protein
MKAYDIMTWGVISIEAEAPFMRAAQLMLEYRIGGLPVIDANRSLIGIVTEGDFLRRGLSIARAWGRVDEIMTPNPYCIAGDTPLEEVVQLMEKHGVKHLPVVDDHQVIGIVSRANLLQAFVKSARETVPLAENGLAGCERSARISIRSRSGSPASSLAE